MHMARAAVALQRRQDTVVQLHHAAMFATIDRRWYGLDDPMHVTDKDGLGHQILLLLTLPGCQRGCVGSSDRQIACDDSKSPAIARVATV